MVFFSGHGRRENGIDYLIPADGHRNVQRSGISVDYVIQQIQKCGADNIVLILDACRDEGNSKKEGEGIGRQTEQEAYEKGVITICSCSPNEYSWELEELQQGVFTYALLEGLGNKGKRATVEKLNEYLKVRVRELAQSKGIQTPRVMADPIEKSHLILMPKYATLSDIANLKNDAARAERKEELEKAKSLWRRVLNAAQGVDEDAIEALNSIAIKEKLGSLGFPIKERDNIEKKHSNSTKEILGEKSGKKVVNESTKESDKREIFNFEVVSVNDSGKVINRVQKSGRQIIEDLGNGIKLEMAYIPGGSFMMGSPKTEAERDNDEGPQHKVTLKPFYMSKYPITQEQYQAIIGDNPSHFKGKKQPVERVRWNNATEYCQKLSKKIGKKYSLPSESQWEYACRAGTTTPFYFGETMTTDLGNYRGTDNEVEKWSGSYGRGPKGEYRQKTTPVGQFPPNNFGLYDMHGNIWECATCWLE